MSHHPFPWRDAFLEALRHMPVLTAGCKAVGIDRSTVFRARQADPDFDAAVREALDEGIDRAEQEAFRRGVDGWTEPVISQGRLVRDEEGNPLLVRKYSDTMLALMLKGRRKQVFAERIEQTGANGGPVQQQTIIVTGVPNADDFDPGSLA